MTSRRYRSRVTPLVALALAAGAMGRPAHGQSLAMGRAVDDARRGGATTSGTAKPAVVAADWQIRAPHGPTTTIGAYRGKVVFLHVWATWCVVCKPELASIERLQRIVARSPVANDVAFLLVSPESDRIVARYIKRHALAPHVFVEAQAAPRALGLTALPVTLILDRDGTIVARHQGLGAWDAPAFVTALQELVHTTALSVRAR